MSSDPSQLNTTIKPEDIVTDYGGLPLSKEAVRDLRDRCNRHLKMASWRLAEFGNYVVHTRHPHMIEQVQYRREDFE